MISLRHIFLWSALVVTALPLLAYQDKYIAVRYGKLMNGNTDQSSSNVSDIEHVLALQAEAWNNGDIEGYMEGYWRSDSLLFTSAGGVRRGWNETLEKYRKSYDTRSKMGTLVFSRIEISLLSDTSAWVFGRWKLRRANDAPGGVFTLIMKKFSNGWKIIHDHTSTEPSTISDKKSQ